MSHCTAGHNSRSLAQIQLGASAFCPDGCDRVNGGCVQDNTMAGLRCQDCLGNLLVNRVRNQANALSRIVQHIRLCLRVTTAASGRGCQQCCWSQGEKVEQTQQRRPHQSDGCCVRTV